MQKEIDIKDDPFMQPRYKPSALVCMAVALVVMGLVAGVLAWFHRGPMLSLGPVETHQKPHCTVTALNTDPYQVGQLRVKFIGRTEQFGEHYDAYEVYGSIIRPSLSAAPTARLFITMKCGLLSLKKVQGVVRELEVGEAKKFTVRVPDATFARLRKAPLDFFIMADQDRARTIIP